MTGSVVERAEAILAPRIHGRAVKGGALGPLTSYHIGGPAELLVEPADEADLEAIADVLRETGLDALVIGRGSNLLVSDRGYRGIAVRLGGGFRWIRAEGALLAAGAAVPLPALAGAALAECLSGLEFAVAIPGSVGGAVRMNAGAHGDCIGDLLEWVDVFSLTQGRRRRMAGSEVSFGYRKSSLPVDAIVTAAALRLRPGEETEIAERMREVREWRRRNQPLSEPNAGSVFVNPPGDSAGRIVERVCGKGMRLGGARISEVHANFIVADEGARSDDVYGLIRRIQRMVREATGIELELEVKLVGFEETEDDSRPG